MVKSAELNLKLPEGFSLDDGDPDLPYLLRKGQIVAYFTPHATPEEIKKEAERQLDLAQQS